jgi:cation:H+ antiporter
MYNPRTLVWFQFALCLAAILFAGSRLARYADIIAEKSKLGRIWVGLALVAMITAMPEMATGISAAALVKSPDLAMGTLIGSCCFNLSLLVILDVVNRKEPTLSRISHRHLPGVRWGIVLLTICAIGMFLGPRVSLPTLGWLSIPSIALMIVYFVALRRILNAERQFLATEMETSARYATFTLKGALVRFFAAAAMVVVAGIWLSYVGDEIAAVTGWGTSFVGNLLLAIATSAPEMVVGISAVRMGSADIAIADILGANMLDTGMVGLVDAFYLRGSLFAYAMPGNLVIILVAVVMVAIAGVAIYRPPRAFLVWRLSWYGPLLVLLYIGAAYVLFLFGRM